MSIALDVSADQLFWDNTEAVTFHKVGFASGTATDSPTDVANALRRGANQRDLMAAELSATAVAMVFNVPVAQLPSVEPDKGDWIEAGDANWSVTKADKLTFGTRWRLICVRQIA